MWLIRTALNAPFFININAVTNTGHCVFQVMLDRVEPAFLAGGISVVPCAPKCA
jgi:hypothetical protein